MSFRVLRSGIRLNQKKAHLKKIADNNMDKARDIAFLTHINMPKTRRNESSKANRKYKKCYINYMNYHCYKYYLRIYVFNVIFLFFIGTVR